MVGWRDGRVLSGYLCAVVGCRLDICQRHAAVVEGPRYGFIGGRECTVTAC